MWLKSLFTGCFQDNGVGIFFEENLSADIGLISGVSFAMVFVTAVLPHFRRR